MSCRQLLTSVPRSSTIASTTDVRTSARDGDLAFAAVVRRLLLFSLLKPLLKDAVLVDLHLMLRTQPWIGLDLLPRLLARGVPVLPRSSGP